DHFFDNLRHPLTTATTSLGNRDTRYRFAQSDRICRCGWFRVGRRLSQTTTVDGRDRMLVLGGLLEKYQPAERAGAVLVLKRKGLMIRPTRPPCPMRWTGPSTTFATRSGW